jgi:hypothetical protein
MTLILARNPLIEWRLRSEESVSFCVVQTLTRRPGT